MGNFISDIYYPEQKRLLAKLASEGKSKEEIAKITNDFANATIPKLIDMVSKDTIKYHEEKMHKEIQQEFHEDDIFVARNMQKWNSAFVTSRMMYQLCVDIAEHYSNSMDKLENNEKEKIHYSFIVLQHLHGRACQIFLEILSLMKNGFPDGAYSRFRSLYEISVIANFICENGENVAKAFYNSHDKKNNNYKWAKAAKCFSTEKRITFNKIQKQQLEFTNNWKKQYYLGCEIVHASSRSTFARIGNWDGMDSCEPVGQSDHGMSLPGEHSAIIMAAVTNTFLSINNDIDSIAFCKIVNDWIHIVRKNYFTIAYERDGREDFLDWLKENTDKYSNNKCSLT